MSTQVLKPTPEQQDCIDKFKTGKTLRINAYAGTGKSSTLKLLGAAAPETSGTCLMFNKAVADEAKRTFPRNISCSTQHSLAFHEIKAQGYNFEKLTGKLNGGYLAKRLVLPTIDVTKDMRLTARQHGFLICQTLRRWCSSGRPEIGPWDVPLDGKLETLDKSTAHSLQRQIANRTQRLWEQLIDKGSDLPLGHDGYLKLWALGRPQIPGRFVMLDEAQDTNGVILEVMKNQQAQVICVGDRHQQIYEWRGAVNAMEVLPVELEARLSTSFRFGTKIAEHATSILELLGETVPLTGNPAKTSTIGKIDEPTAILFRTNGSLIECIFGLIEAGKRPCVVGGVSDIQAFINGAEKLMAGQSVDNPLELFGFAYWQEVQETSEMPGEDELRRWVRLIDKYGIDGLRKALYGLPQDEKRADVVLATGHKSKGREWPSVRLEDDFLRGVRTREEDDKKAPLETMQPSSRRPVDGQGVDSELRLFYVAATRGQVRLDVHPKLKEKLAIVRKNRQPEDADAAA